MIVNTPLYQQLKLLPVEVSHTALGTFGEILVARLLCDQGWRQLQSHKRGDLTMANPDGVMIDIEIKTARRDSQNKWQFCLRKPKHTDATRSDWTVLLAVQWWGLPVPFVVPSALLNTKSAAIYNSPYTYNGWLAKYRQSIDSLSLSNGEHQQ